MAQIPEKETGEIQKAKEKEKGNVSRASERMKIIASGESPLHWWILRGRRSVASGGRGLGVSIYGGVCD